MPQCRATTKAGTRCKNQAVGDTDYCRVHEDQAEETEAPGAREGRRARAGRGERAGAGARPESGDEAGGDEGEYSWEATFERMGEATRTLLGFATVGAIVLAVLKLGKGWPR